MPPPPFAQTLAREGAQAASALQLTPGIQEAARRLTKHKGKLVVLHLDSPTLQPVPCPENTPSRSAYCLQGKKGGGVFQLDLDCLWGYIALFTKNSAVRLYVIATPQPDVDSWAILTKHLGKADVLQNWGDIARHVVDVGAAAGVAATLSPKGELLRVVLESEVAINSALFISLPQVPEAEFVWQIRTGKWGQQKQSLELGPSTCLNAIAL